MASNHCRSGGSKGHIRAGYFGNATTRYQHPTMATQQGREPLPTLIVHYIYKTQSHKPTCGSTYLAVVTNQKQQCCRWGFEDNAEGAFRTQGLPGVSNPSTVLHATTSTAFQHNSILQAQASCLGPPPTWRNLASLPPNRQAWSHRM